MRTWQVIGIHESDWRKDFSAICRTKAEAMSLAKRLKRDRCDEFESISIIADNGTELLDDTEVVIK